MKKGLSTPLFSPKLSFQSFLNFSNTSPRISQLRELNDYFLPSNLADDLWESSEKSHIILFINSNIDKKNFTQREIELSNTFFTKGNEEKITIDNFNKIYSNVYEILTNFIEKCNELKEFLQDEIELKEKMRYQLNSIEIIINKSKKIESFEKKDLFQHFYKNIKNQINIFENNLEILRNDSIELKEIYYFAGKNNLQEKKNNQNLEVVEEKLFDDLDQKSNHIINIRNKLRIYYEILLENKKINKLDEKFEFSKENENNFFCLIENAKKEIKKIAQFILESFNVCELICKENGDLNTYFIEEISKKTFFIQKIKEKFEISSKKILNLFGFEEEILYSTEKINRFLKDIELLSENIYQEFSKNLFEIKEIYYFFEKNGKNENYNVQILKQKIKITKKFYENIKENIKNIANPEFFQAFFYNFRIKLKGKIKSKIEEIENLLNVIDYFEKEFFFRFENIINYKFEIILLKENLEEKTIEYNFEHIKKSYLKSNNIYAEILIEVNFFKNLSNTTNFIFLLKFFEKVIQLIKSHLENEIKSFQKIIENKLNYKIFQEVNEFLDENEIKIYKIFENVEEIESFNFAKSIKQGEKILEKLSKLSIEKDKNLLKKDLLGNQMNENLFEENIKIKNCEIKAMNIFKLTLQKIDIFLPELSQNNFSNFLKKFDEILDYFNKFLKNEKNNLRKYIYNTLILYSEILFEIYKIFQKNSNENYVENLTIIKNEIINLENAEIITILPFFKEKFEKNINKIIKRIKTE